MIKKLICKFIEMNEGAKSALSYTMATMLSKGLAIITVPIFARIMTTEQIGNVNLFNSWFSLVGAFATLSLTSGGYLVALNEFSDNREKYQSSVLSLTSLIALFLMFIYIISPDFWEELTGLSQPLLILMLLGFLFSPAMDFWLARQRFEYKYKKPVAIIMTSSIVASILSIIVVLHLDKTGSNLVAEGRLFANYIILFGVAAILWLNTLIKGKVFFNIEYWKFSLSLSIPLIGYSIAAQILSVSDRVMIGRMVNNSAVGIYSTLYSVSSISLLIWQAIHASYVPFLFNNFGKENTTLKKNTNYLVITYAFFALGLTYFAPEIVRILATPEYYEAIYIMPAIAAGIFLTCFTNLYSDIPLYYKKTKYVMFPAIIAAILNVVLNYICIPIFGYMIAAYTTLISYVMWAILQAYWCKKICYQNRVDTNTLFDDKSLFVIALITIALCLFSTLLYNLFLVRYIFIIINIIIGSICFYRFRKYK